MSPGVRVVWVCLVVRRASDEATGNMKANEQLNGLSWVTNGLLCTSESPILNPKGFRHPQLNKLLGRVWSSKVSKTITSITLKEEELSKNDFQEFQKGLL